MPASEKKLYIAMTTEPSRQDEQEAKSEIDSVLNKLSKTDATSRSISESAKSKNSDNIFETTKAKSHYPAVRGKVTSTVKALSVNEEEQKAENRKTDSRKGSFKEYYDMWSKFDDEKVCKG